MKQGTVVCVDMNVCMHEEDGLIRETAPGPLNPPPPPIPSQKVTLCQRLEYILCSWHATKWQVQWQIFSSSSASFIYFILVKQQKK